MAEWSDARIKYLEMLQTTINRMCNNSSALKGWTVATVSGVLVFAGQGMNHNFILLALIPSVIFMFLDGYYLQCERKYRVLFGLAQRKKASAELFSMVPKKPKMKDKTMYWQALISKTVALFYLPLMAATVFVFQLAPNYK